ncbi:MAG: hypothetical protein MN733_20555, partial [Nitrososphaera sp.]|nr:hypothetical protein [Nitrososphaera sp.]
STLATERCYWQLNPARLQLSLMNFCPTNRSHLSKLLVDGGLRSNYPLWIFDTERQQSGVELPIVGFRLEQDFAEIPSHSLLEDYIWGLVNAALEGPSWLQEEGMKNVVEVPVPIPPHVRATSFDLGDTEKQFLFLSGYSAASAVLLNADNRAILGLA